MLPSVNHGRLTTEKDLSHRMPVFEIRFDVFKRIIEVTKLLLLLQCKIICSLKNGANM